MTDPIEIDEKIENLDFSNYFEDGNITGIRMKYRLQFVLYKYKTMEDILASFDLYPSRVLYDGQTTYMTKKAEHAYRYMINIVNENNYSTLFEHRMSKYLTYGFSIVLPALDIKKAEEQGYMNFGTLKFKINRVDKNNITIEHNSHREDQLKSLQSLEEKNLKEGKSLYKSSLFCSLVSLLRYVKINDINYTFTKDICYPNNDGTMEFKNGTDIVHFIDPIKSRISDHDFYGDLRK